MPVAREACEGEVEVGADVGVGAGRGQGVAAAALLREELLAALEVGVLLQVAAGQRRRARRTASRPDEELRLAVDGCLPASHRAGILYAGADRPTPCASGVG